MIVRRRSWGSCPLRRFVPADRWTRRCRLIDGCDRAAPARISACPGPRVVHRPVTPVSFHREIWPSCKRSARDSEALGSRAVGLKRTDKPRQAQRDFRASNPVGDPCTLKGAFGVFSGRSCRGFCLFQDCRTLARRSAAAAAFPVVRRTRLGTRVSSHTGMRWRDLSVHGFTPRFVPRACKQCRPQRDAFGFPFNVSSDRRLAASLEVGRDLKLLRPRSRDSSFLFEVLHRSLTCV